jgi:hypothetical protein
LNDTYAFTIPGGPVPVSSLVDVTLNNPGTVGIANLVLSWYLDGNPVALVSETFTNGSGTWLGVGSVLFPFTLPGGPAKYLLVVTGTILSGGGGYDIELSAVPLPPALILFGTALVGMTLLGKRRRKQMNAAGAS